MVYQLTCVVGFIWRFDLWHFILAQDFWAANLSAFTFLLQAVDVFAVNAASPGNRLNIARNIANMWAVPAQEAEALYCLNRPVLEVFFCVN